MSTQIFVNLPVKDLDRSKEFFAKLGFSFNAQFTDENASCMVVSESIYVMLLTRKFFQSFIPTEICDAIKSTEVLVCLSSEGRSEVDEMIRQAIAQEVDGNAYLREIDVHPAYGRKGIGRKLVEFVLGQENRTIAGYYSRPFSTLSGMPHSMQNLDFRFCLRLN
jgi:uncharacterized protein